MELKLAGGNALNRESACFFIESFHYFIADWILGLLFRYGGLCKRSYLFTKAKHWALKSQNLAVSEMKFYPSFARNQKITDLQKEKKTGVRLFLGCQNVFRV